MHSLNISVGCQCDLRAYTSVCLREKERILWDLWNPTGKMGFMGRQPLLPTHNTQAQQQQQLVATQDSYLSSRAEALHNVEATIHELSNIFMQLNTMVSGWPLHDVGAGDKPCELKSHLSATPLG